MADGRVPIVASERLGVFLAAEAYACGWTPPSLTRAVAGGRLLRLRRGAYVEADLDADLHPAEQSRRHRARCSVAAALLTSGSTVTGLSAAAVSGWSVWAPRELACLTVTDSRSTSLRGVHLHRGDVRAGARRPLAGFRITTPARTVVDIAREYGTEAGLVAADVAVRLGATSPDALRDEVARLVGRVGVGHARPVAELVDPRSESVLESRSRWQFVLHDVPAPEPQVWLYGLDGAFLGRSDFYWDVGVVGEVDGAEKLTDAEARHAYLRRQHALDRARLRVARWNVRDLRAFRRTATWIRQEIAAARADPRPRRWIASPRRLGSEFAVRALLAGSSDPSRRGQGWSEVLQGLTAGEG